MPLAKCKRCAGTGKIAVRFSLPGADHHGSYIDIEWDGPTRYRECVKCMATGWGKPDYTPNAGVIVTFDERGRPHRRDMEGEPDNADFSKEVGAEPDSQPEVPSQRKGKKDPG